MTKLTRNLMDINIPEPETRDVVLPRLGLTLRLRELSYDKVQSLRNLKEDRDLHFVLALVQEPNFRDGAWYGEKMGCATPVEAMKRLLRPGEIEAVMRAGNRLCGYGGGNLMDVTGDDEAAVMAALDDLAKN
jgi:hypothetical protein